MKKDFNNGNIKFAVVGNREGFTYEYIKSTLDDLRICKTDIIISGGAEGVDSFAEKYAKEKGCEIRIFNPDPSKPSPKRYFDRNMRVVVNADVIIAFNKKERSGTTNTINYAIKLNKQVIKK